MNQPTSGEPPKKTSLDRASLANWRFSETNGFVVKDFTGVSDEAPDPLILVVKSHEIFEVLADANEQGRKIAVYAIGPCVLDQS